GRSESCPSSPKACREKLRKDRLNDIAQAEKNELCDEKQRLNECTTFHAVFYYEPCYICSSSQVPDNKLVPIISYPGAAMWQFMSPVAADTW
ncbi:hypothetical protein HN873_007834, partial [Arachis hypogaea]